MTNKQIFKNIMERKSNVNGFWHGCPNEASTDYLFGHYNVKDDFELGIKLNSTLRWVQPEAHNLWANKERPMFDFLGGEKQVSLSQDGVFANTEDVKEIELFDWPKPENCDFTDTIAEIDRAVEAGQAVLSGIWSPFFHDACNFFGMENYFVKMHTDPEVVEAVSEHLVDFYLKVNKKLFELTGDKIDAFFFGNDFGSQLDLLISPESFDKFVMPYFKKLTNLAHSFGKYVVLHSCGSIDRVIPKLIDAGVNAIHPIQAKARNMDAESLVKKYGNDIIFVGGVDTQELLPFKSPTEVYDEVMRLRELFGPNFIVSPSHESILPGVTTENIDAMMKAALDL